MTTAFVGRRLVWVRRHGLRARFLSRDAEETVQDTVEPDARPQRRFADSQNGPSAPSSAIRVKEFFERNKPPPKPPLPQPKKEWLLRRLPEPEEVAEKPEEVPAAGNIEEERNWLNFGDHSDPRRRPLITHTPEFHRIARDIEREMVQGGSERPRGVPRMRVNSAFTPKRSSPAAKHLYLEGGHRKGVFPSSLLTDGSREAAYSYEGVDGYFESMSGETVGPKKQRQPDGFADIMSAMKANMSLRQAAQENRPSERPPKQGLTAQQHVEDIQLERPRARTVSLADEEKSHAESIYGQLVMEELSEEALHPSEEGPVDYDYKPMRPRFLNPPDGETVSAVPQREFNDFTPYNAVNDFWNESSALRFEDPGQDPGKPNRHKLHGQEYWVAKPMLMEKYDYEDEGLRSEVETGRHPDLDPEIPPHFVDGESRMAPLTVPESRTYEEFFDPSGEHNSIPNRRRLFSMSAPTNMYTNKVTIESEEAVIGGRALNGYTVPRVAGSSDMEEMHPEIKDWLYDTPTVRDDGYSQLFAAAKTSGELDSSHTALKEDGYGRIEKFISQSRLPAPSRERVKEIELLEGLREETWPECQVEAYVEEANEAEKYYDGVDVQSLHVVMEAESRYHDMFSDEKSECMPEANFRQTEQVRMLNRLNRAETPDTRPRNQLIQSPSRSDFDEWMLRELRKCSRDGQVYGDVFQLVCQPRMLEIAFTSLKRRRPGSVPKALESNFFELASRILGSGDIVPNTAVGPRQPLKNAGLNGLVIPVSCQQDFTASGLAHTSQCGEVFVVRCAL